MAEPLNKCTVIEQRSVVRFLWAKDMAAKDIHKETLPVTSSNPLKQHLSGESFPEVEAFERAVRAWFRQQPQEFYAVGFQGFVKG